MLKAIVDSIDDLPEPIKALYKHIEDEGDLKGKWLLQVEGVMRSVSWRIRDAPVGLG